MIQYELGQQLITEAWWFGDFDELEVEGFWLIGLGSFFDLLNERFLLDKGEVGAVIGIAKFDEFFIERFIESKKM